MKSTLERLKESYCRPQTEKEYKSVIHHGRFRGGKQILYYNPVLYNDRDGGIDQIDLYEGINRTEIPFQHFDDLVHDRIVPWRLLEDGFASYDHIDAGIAYEFKCHDDAVLTCAMYSYGSREFNLWPTDIDGETADLGVPIYGIRTYTDLLTPIRLIG